MNCSYCGAEFEWDGSAACESCKKKPSEDLSLERYKEALLRFRSYIEKGGELWMYDDTTIGQKNTECSWGLCCQSKEMWPDPEDHIWPYAFKTEDRIAPKDLGVGNPCPMDKRGPTSLSWGCFYECRMFQGPQPNKEEALKLYDLCLEKLNVSK